MTGRMMTQTRARVRTRQISELAFTLVELMIVVAIVAALAGVALYAYSRHINSSRIVEAHELLGRIMLQQEAYYSANGSYCNASTTPSTYQPAIGGDFIAKTWNPPSTWDGLALTVDKGATYFSYLVVAGSGPTFAAVSGDETASLGVTTGRPWYYAIARADMKHDGTPYTELSVTSQRTNIVVQNEGE